MFHEKLKIMGGHAIRYPTSMEARDNWKLRHVSRVLHATRNIECTRKKVTRTFSVSSNWNFGENSRVCVYIYIPIAHGALILRVSVSINFVGDSETSIVIDLTKFFVVVELFEEIRKCLVLNIYGSSNIFMYKILKWYSSL